MLKFITTASLLFLLLNGFSQTTSNKGSTTPATIQNEKVFIDYFKNIKHDRAKYAFKVGFNYNTAKVKFYDTDLSSGYKPGFSAGLLIKAVLEKNLHFSPYIGYSMRGYTHTLSATSISKYDNVIHYLDIVPAFSYDIKRKKHGFIVSVGPYAAVAFSGTEKTTTTSGVETKKMKFSSEENYGRLDLGLNTSIAYQYKKFFIEAGYQYGFTNINNNADVKISTYSPLVIDPRDIRNRVINVSLGYYIR